MYVEELDFENLTKILEEAECDPRRQSLQGWIKSFFEPRINRQICSFAKPLTYKRKIRLAENQSKKLYNRLKVMKNCYRKRREENKNLNCDHTNLMRKFSESDLSM